MLHFIADKRAYYLLLSPAQSVPCIYISQSSQVEDAIADSALPDYLAKCNAQIDRIVEVVRGPLSAGATITIEALVVLDVHGKWFPAWPIRADHRFDKTNKPAGGLCIITVIEREPVPGRMLRAR